MDKESLIKAMKGVKNGVEVRVSDRRNPPRSLKCVRDIQIDKNWGIIIITD